jgi:hypothetical protein
MVKKNKDLVYTIYTLGIMGFELERVQGCQDMI